MSTWMPLALVRKIEYSLLEPHLNRQDIEAGCEEAQNYDSLAVVVKPQYVEWVHKLLKDTHIKTASVVGYPHGSATTATKMYETQDIVQRGAEEISMVMNLGALRDHEDLLVHNDILTIVRTARGRPVTVIVESFYLTDEEIQRACELAEKAGAAMIQAGTCSSPAPITTRDLMVFRAASPRALIKAAGGIESLDAALELLGAGATRVVTGHLI
jgi:deoxyribose-phosphate aldolase